MRRGRSGPGRLLLLLSSDLPAPRDCFPLEREQGSNNRQDCALSSQFGDSVLFLSNDQTVRRGVVNNAPARLAKLSRGVSLTCSRM